MYEKALSHTMGILRFTAQKLGNQFLPQNMPPGHGVLRMTGGVTSDTKVDILD